MKFTSVVVLCMVGISFTLAKYVHNEERNELESDLERLLSLRQKRCSDYACKDDFDSLSNTVTELVADVATLKANYESNTVRKCLSGSYYYACDPYCGDKGEDWPNGVVKTVTFSSAFHKTPRVIVSVNRYDDYDNTDVRYQVYVSSKSSTQFKFTLKSQADSKMSYIDIGWMACA